MLPASQPPGLEKVRDAVTARYSDLARAARSGQQISDCARNDF